MTSSISWWSSLWHLLMNGRWGLLRITVFCQNHIEMLFKIKLLCCNITLECPQGKPLCSLSTQVHQCPSLAKILKLHGGRLLCASRCDTWVEHAAAPRNYLTRPVNQILPRRRCKSCCGETSIVYNDAGPATRRPHRRGTKGGDDEDIWTGVLHGVRKKIVVLVPPNNITDSNDVVKQCTVYKF